MKKRRQSVRFNEIQKHYEGKNNLLILFKEGKIANFKNY